jgi:hypothetical protein
VLGKTLGEGTFGKVKLGTHILTGEKVSWFNLFIIISNVGRSKSTRKTKNKR